VALVVGTVVSAWQAVRATRAESLAGARLVAERQARQDADTNFQKARQAVDEYFTVVSDSPLLDAPGLEPLRKQLLETALRYNREFIKQHSEDADLQADVAAAHSRVSEITYLVGGSRDKWFPHMRDAADIVSRLIEEHRDTPEVQQRLARIHLSIGRTEGAIGSVDTRDVLRYLQKQAQNWEKFVRDNPDDAKFRNTLAGIYYYLAGTEGVVSKKMDWANKAVQIWEKLARENPKVPGYRIDLAKCHEERASILNAAGRGQEANQETQRALRLRQELARDFPERASHRAWLAVSYRTLGEMQSARKEFKDAEKTLRSAMELQEKLVAEFPSVHTYQDDLAKTQQDLGAVFKNLGKSVEAEAAYRHALGGFEQLVVAFPRAARYQTQLLQTAKELAQLLEASGQPQKKREILDEVFAAYEKLTAQLANTSEDLQAMAARYQNLANLLRESGQPEEAEKAYGKGLAVREKLATDFPQVDQHIWDLAASYIEAAHLLQDARRYNEAAKIYERARTFLETRAAQFPEQTEFRAELGRIHNHTGWLLSSSGRPSEAEKAHRQALALYEKLAQVKSKSERSRRHRQELAWTHHWLGHLLANRNRPQEAEKAFRQAIALEEELDTDFPNQGHSGWIAGECGNLATLFIRLSQWDKAAAAYAKVDLLARPPREDAFAYACLLLIRGDSEGYNRFCQGMIQHTTKTEDPFEASVLARSCAMARKCPIDPAQAVHWANQAVARANYAWYIHVLGLAQYRAGQFDQALQSFTRANVEYWSARYLNWFGLALVHHRLGHPDEARRCLDKGIQWLERERPRSPEQPVNVHAMDWLEAEVLRREAENLLKIKRTP
jgi:tetratricopeptide (TPR) repeat protein